MSLKKSQQSEAVQNMYSSKDIGEIDFTSGCIIQRIELTFNSITYAVMEKAHTLLNTNNSEL